MPYFFSFLVSDSDTLRIYIYAHGFVSDHEELISYCKSHLHISDKLSDYNSAEHIIINADYMFGGLPHMEVSVK